ncbi:BTAD domain-containing putative transcriptional regulator [Dactylosporangium sp. CS-033363]|uniref:AfsR/SARP family transcriptional regulator n=1 Tax=Dactylosporangium sp. CS-033363 TaxID=3239935 RepID=UPI003D8F741F
MRYRLLGPLEVGTGDHVWRPRGRRERAMLTVLLLRPNRPIGLGELIDATWDAAPATARQQVHSTVHRLRAVLGDETVRTVASGYLFAADPAEVDVAVFTELAADARRAAAAGRIDDAVGLYRQAADLWRGPALADLDTPPLAVEGARLAELRLAVLAERFDAELAVGGDPLPELTALVAEHPYAERLRGQLMTALHRAGRRAEALAVYREGHRRLVEDLGIEPGPQLRELQQSILLDAEVPPAAPEPQPEREAPCLLPPPPRLLVGREDAVAWLLHRLDADRLDTDRLDTARPDTGRLDTARLDTGRLDTARLDTARREFGRVDTDAQTTRVLAVCGAAGIGKSALVMAVAHRVRAQFPGGQLHVRLGAPGGAWEAHASVLIALGVPPAAIPAGPGEREALYRARLGGRRVLLVLDDAPDAATVRALSPGTGGVVLVTSRPRLLGLTEAEHLELGLLGPGPSRALLDQIVGAGRTGAEPAATGDVIRYCGGLPLALCVAGARLAGRHELPVAAYSQRLADERRRLAALSTSDGGVGASLLVSYRGLGAPARTALRRLGALATRPFPAWTVACALGPGPLNPGPLNPGPLSPGPLSPGPLGPGPHSPGSPGTDADERSWTVAATPGAPGPDADEPLDADLVVDELADAQLVQSVGAARYHLHDLVRIFAAERCAEEEEPASVRAAAERILGGWLAAALAAVERFSGDRPAQAWGVTELAEISDWSVSADPLAWLDAEVDSVAAAVHQAHELGLDELCWRLAWVLRNYLEARGRWQLWDETTRAGLEAARRSGDRVGEACMLVSLAQRVASEGGCVDDRDAVAAYKIFDAEGHAVGRSVALFAMAEIAEWRHDGEDVRHYFRRAIAAAREAGDEYMAVNAEAKLVRWDHEDDPDAPAVADAYRDCRDRLRGMGAIRQAAMMERRLGMWYEAHARHDEALACFSGSLRDAQELRDETGVAYLSLDLGRLDAAGGRGPAAAEHFTEALTLFTRHGDETGAARARLELGRLCATEGRVEEARTLLRAAHDRFAELGHTHWCEHAALALAGLAAA